MKEKGCLKADCVCECYLPNHPVFQPEKPGKIRRVPNGAPKFHCSFLNNALLTGPELLQNVIHILIRFRHYQYGVSVDFEGMFLQVASSFHKTNLRFVFRGWRTQLTKSLCTSRCVLFLDPRIRQQVPTMLYNVKHETTKSRFSKLLLS